MQKLRTSVNYIADGESCKGIVINVFMCVRCGSFLLVDKASKWRRSKPIKKPMPVRQPHKEELTADEKNFLGRNTLTPSEMKQYIQDVKEHTEKEKSKESKAREEDERFEGDNIGRM